MEYENNPVYKPGQRFLVGDLVYFKARKFRIESVIDINIERVPRELFDFARKRNDRLIYVIVCPGDRQRAAQSSLKAAPGECIALGYTPADSSFNALLAPLLDSQDK